MQKKRPFHSGVHPSAAPHPAAGGRNNAGPGQRRDFAKRDKNDHYINDQIRAHEVRLVGDNVEEGVYPIAKAQRIADDQGLDLILIAPQAQPPVCRIMDYQKFQYQQRKRLKEQKAKQAKVVVKEIRFGPQTDDHDYDFKLKHAIGFLQDGCKVKSYVFFKGRSILFKDQGELLLTKFTSDLEVYGKPDQWPPVLEGKRMTVMISPKKNKDAKKAAPKPQAEPKQEEPKGDAE